MLYFLLILFLLIIISLIVRINYIVEYDNALYVKIKVSFLKITLFSSTDLKKPKISDIFNFITKVRNGLLELYHKFRGSLKIKSVFVDAKISFGDPYVTAMAFGTANILFSTFLSYLDSVFMVKENTVNSNIVADFQDTSPHLKLKIVFYTSLFSLAAFSTYAFFKNRILRRKKWKKASKVK